MERLLARAKLPACALDDAEALFALPSAIAFLEGSARAEGIENLGYLLGQEASSVEGLGTFGHLILQSLTLHDAIETARRMMPSYSSGQRVALAAHGDQMWLCVGFVDGLEPHPQTDVYTLMLMIDLVRAAAGPAWQPSEVHLTARRSSGWRDIEALSNGRIAFEQGVTAITFPRSLLSLPLSRALAGDGVQRLEAWRSSAPADDLPGSLRQAIGMLMRGRHPDIRLIAGVVGMSARTLQRRLADAGVGYARLLAQARFDAAVRLLEGPRMKLVDIALELGYSDHAHFTRAFRQWTGASPREFRQRKLWEVATDPPARALHGR